MSVPSPEGASPAMAAWFAAKAAHPDALVFFRMGDFYELFFADAEAAASALDIALTQRGEHAGRPIQMCGVPAHAAESYLLRLIRRGFRVAVAEQLETPAEAKARRAPIRREVVRLVTPGTLTEDALLDRARPNLLLALAPGKERLGAAWLDVSTGAFETAAVAPGELGALLGRLDPAEIVAPEDLPVPPPFDARCAPPVPASPPDLARRRLAEAFGAASLDAFGAFEHEEAQAAALALDYVRATQAGKLPRLSRPVPSASGTLAMDAATRASLEILAARDGDARHTLFAAIDRTLSAAGARLLAARLSAPLTDPAGIALRQDSWTFLLGAGGLAAMRAALRRAPDMARALGRLSLGRGGARELAAIRDGLHAAAEIAAVLKGELPAELATARAALGLDTALADELARALADSLPARADEEGAIRPGYDGELDGERRLRDEARQVIAGLQLDYAQRYGVASLKIRHHAQLGYVIEAPQAAVETLRAHPDLTLRQAMANSARFSTAELADLDRRIAEAAHRAAARERAVLAALIRRVLHRADAIAAAAEALAVLDVAQSAAGLAGGGSWCRPEVTADTDFVVDAGRHPVVEAALPPGAAFVPNRCDLSPDRRLMLLTGPNMAGKSTFLRQNALMIVLAQAGLPVPAASARIGAADRLFSRVGAQDELARGRSTFMVEMTEAAAILHQAGPRSFVIVDEIGRGTATWDGLAIAWAVLEALHDAHRCRTIFATHFHELAGLTGRLPRMRPHTMAVKEWKGQVVFLHEVAEGAGGKSFGVHVARLAGLPAPVVARAGRLLAELERRGGGVGEDMPLFAAAARPPQEPDPLHAEVASLDPDSLTPRAALEILYRLKALLPLSTNPDLPSGE